MNKAPDLLKFWAKTSDDAETRPNAYHPWLGHLIDVAAAARLMGDEVLSTAARERIAAAFDLDGGPPDE